MTEYNIRTHFVLVIAISAFLLLGCNAGTDHKASQAAQSTAVDSDDIAVSKKKVMDLHNQTMAKMDSLMLLKAELNSILKKGAISDENEKKVVNSDIEALEKADNDMMDWMHQYKSPDKKWDHEKAKKYLDDQYLKILNVKKEMDTSMKNAQLTIQRSK